MTATIDDIAKTLGEFEAIAQKTGEWDGADAVEFSIDGSSWSTVWAAVGDWRFPPFARATVRRKGVTAPTVIVVAWDESVPADDEWRALWERKPMKLFGSFALRSAIRHAFRDVVGDLRGPDEGNDGPTIGKPADDTDWDGQLQSAADVEALDAVWERMREYRARTGAREKAHKARRAELLAAAWTPAEVPELSSDELARHHAFFGRDVEQQVQFDDGSWSRDIEIRPRRAGRQPQDHRPPVNRAARRAASRKRR